MLIAERSEKRWIALIANGLLVLCAFALPISTSATDVLFPLAIVLHLVSGRWRDIRLTPVMISLVIFFLLFLWGMSYTIAPPHDMTHRLLQIGCLLLSAFLMSTVIDEPVRVWMINAFLLAMVLTLLLSFLKSDVLHIAANGRLDTSDVFKDHIIQNFLMVMALFICLYRWLNHYRYRAVYAALILLMTYNILFMSSGRSGYFIFVALALFTGFMHVRWRGVLMAALIVIFLIGGASLFSHSFKHRLMAIQQNTVQYSQGQPDTSVGIRIESMKNAYHLFLQKPWLGYGTGSFATAYQKLPTHDLGAVGPVPLSYNNYLNVAVELGVIGLAALLVMFALQWRYSFYLPGEQRYVTQILLLAMILGCLANPWLSDTTELHFYALFLAVGFSAFAEKNKLLF